MGYFSRVLAGLTLVSSLLATVPVEWPYPRLAKCVPGSLCTCSYSPKFEENILCPHVSVFIGAYMFSKHTVIISCKDGVRDDSVLSPLSDVIMAASYDTLRLVNCPMPNSSYADIFSGDAKGFERLEIDSTTNHSVVVGKRPFQGLKGLSELVLRFDNLHSISTDAFDDLEDLFSLTIVLNRLQDFGGLPVGLFANRTNLVKVRVMGNIHKDVSLDDITPTVNDLVYKSCRDNNFSFSFPQELFWNMRGMSELSLSNCRLTQLTQDTFTNSTDVRKLELNHNSLTLLDKDTFKTLEDLIRLDLSYNQIELLPEGIFDSNKKLLWLNLNHNRLKVIPSSTFANTPGLYILDLSFNEIEEISGDQFSLLGELGFLDLAGNQLASLRDRAANHSVLHKCKGLWYLDLSRNLLSEVYGDWATELRNLKLLNLSRNAFTSIQMEDLHLSSNVSLDLSHNMIESVHVSAQKTELELEENSNNSTINSTNITTTTTTTTTVVNLDNNFFNCTCSLRPFIKLYLESSNSRPTESSSKRKLEVKIHPVNELKCSHPEELKGVALKNISHSEYFQTISCLNVTDTDPIT